MKKKNLPMKKTSLRSIAILCSALILAASGWASIKIGNFPFYFVLQNMFAIFFAAIWGGIQGAAVTGIMLLAGMLGAPVFAHGAGGLAYFSGNSGGFLTGYFLASLLTGYMAGNPKQDEKTPFNKIFSSCLGGFILIYVIGIFHFIDINGIKFTKSIFKLFSAMGLKWYLISDAVKLIICSISAYFLRPVCAKYFYEPENL